MEQNSTDSNIPYCPTKKEESLLDVLLNPLNRLKNVEEICRIAHCDKKTYYNSFNKPEFVAYYREQSIALTTKAVAPVINACVREAIRGSHNHAKIVLGMADVYHERKEVTGKGGTSVMDPLVALLQQLDGNTKDLVSK
jgi:hypothetical protein